MSAMFESVEISLPLIAWVLLAYYGVGMFVAAACVLLALTVNLVSARKRVWKQQFRSYLRHLLLQKESEAIPVAEVIGEEVK